MRRRTGPLRHPIGPTQGSLPGRTPAEAGGVIRLAWFVADRATRLSTTTCQSWHSIDTCNRFDTLSRWCFLERYAALVPFNARIRVCSFCCAKLLQVLIRPSSGSVKHRTIGFDDKRFRHCIPLSHSPSSRSHNDLASEIVVSLPLFAGSVSYRSQSVRGLPSFPKLPLSTTASISGQESSARLPNKYQNQ